ncbi:hypothetical protein HELRODRAFT_161963 [Helobdella robusta]|uniref:Uncharacterized protein n=1 Tax=Helobdella robusta TaxID=6412 RepID=T1ES34_HELRO|nr:hypothetical protein HELRODRAFT_161963 [Helobdella robusta]ESO02672.1 hypothetical protein HELRODRAFT_161963 [Helobdella robusta]
MTSRISTSRIVGLSWQQIVEENSENEEQKDEKLSSCNPNLETRIPFGNVSNKLPSKSRRAVFGNKIMKSLNQGVNSSFGAMQERVLRRATRSDRLMMKRNEVKMYSPFEIDSPSIRAPPLRPKMGIVEKQHARYLWSSPESIKAGIYSMTNDMQALANLSDDWSTPASNQRARRSNVRTTTRGYKSPRSKKPLFI